ncbi:MAG: ribosomal protein [Verrucomicrobiota bacterium]|jgi:small subunit ribosomal protein S8
MSNVSDPIADFLTRIRNGSLARAASIITPCSKMLIALSRILEQEGFIGSWAVSGEGANRRIRLSLKYVGSRPVISGLQRVSRPGLRKYVGAGSVPKVVSGMGVSILSTPAGVLSSREAKRRNVGGELLAFVW